MKFAIVKGERREAEPGLSAACVGCGKAMVAKCGELRVWHWAHRGAWTCDRWWEPETKWHRVWKNNFPKEWQEVVGTAENGERHIADVRTKQGLVLEFQHSFLSEDLYTPLELRGAAVGLLSLLRNEGGSVGTSMAQTLHERRDQFHTLRLGEQLDPLNPAVNSFIDQVQAQVQLQTGDPAAIHQLAWQAVENLRQQQASALSYFDCFWIFAMVTLALASVVPLMKRSVAEKGARVISE